MDQVEKYIVRTDGLSHSFKNLTAVDNVSINVPEGSIYGFLGPNGAGKTTTIRLLLGLISARRGNITLFQDSSGPKNKSLLKRIGAMVETPSLYPNMTGRDNLEITCILKGVKKQDIDRVLKIVDLADDSTRKVKEYSHGMKQRLGLALALLGEPELLILDEPMNGLDPQGMRDMRTLISKLSGDYGCTVFLSSHLLTEIQQTADHVGIIKNGSLLFQGSLKELQSKSKPRLLVKTEYIDESIRIISENNWKTERRSNNEILVDVSNRKDIESVNSLLVQNNLPVYHLEYVQDSLEDIFLELTG
ncbi:ATP-binding cassette domain-containing protein [candidate division KSB1 bacterium]